MSIASIQSWGAPTAAPAKPREAPPGAFVAPDMPSSKPTGGAAAVAAIPAQPLSKGLQVSLLQLQGAGPGDAPAVSTGRGTASPTASDRQAPA